jgi:hypothetical protein
MQESNQPPPCNISAIEGVIRHSKFRELAEQPYVVASWQNVLMGLHEINLADLLHNPYFISFMGLSGGFLPSTTAMNPENSETEGASVARMKGG